MGDVTQAELKKTDVALRVNNMTWQPKKKALEIPNRPRQSQEVEKDSKRCTWVYVHSLVDRHVMKSI